MGLLYIFTLLHGINKIKVTCLFTHYDGVTLIITYSVSDAYSTFVLNGKTGNVITFG
jgi:hypothetical protein